MPCSHKWGYIPGETPDPTRFNSYFSCLHCKCWGWRPAKGDRSIRAFSDSRKRQEWSRFWQWMEHDRLTKGLRELDNPIEDDLCG